MVKSQASISKELAETVRILRSHNFKYSREVNVELEILMFKVLCRNLNDRTSRMFSVDYPLIYGVSIMKALYILIYYYYLAILFKDGRKLYQLQHSTCAVSSFAIHFK